MRGRAARCMRLSGYSPRVVARIRQVALSSRRAAWSPLVWQALVLCALVLGACAGTGSGADAVQPTVPVQRFSTAVADQQFRVKAEPAIRWSPSELQATAGDITFIVSNPTALNHDFAIQGNGVNARSAVLRPGSTTTLTLTGLAAGTYRYVCTIPGHEVTMVGTLIVK